MVSLSKKIGDQEAMSTPRLGSLLLASLADGIRMQVYTGRIWSQFETRLGLPNLFQRFGTPAQKHLNRACSQAFHLHCSPGLPDLSCLVRSNADASLGAFWPIFMCAYSGLKGSKACRMKCLTCVDCLRSPELHQAGARSQHFVCASDILSPTLGMHAK